MSSIRQLRRTFPRNTFNPDPNRCLASVFTCYITREMESVAALFCEMIGAIISSSNNNNSYNDSATIDRSHYFLNDRYYYNNKVIVSTDAKPSIGSSKYPEEDSHIHICENLSRHGAYVHSRCFQERGSE